MRSRVGAAELDGAVYDAASGNLRMVNGRERADRFGLRILEDFRVGTHRRPDEVVPIEIGAHSLELFVATMRSISAVSAAQFCREWWNL